MREALIELAHEGPENLTVSAICQATGVDRATFYRHFPDLEHLVADTLGHLADEAATRWESTAEDVRREPTSSSPALLQYFAHIEENWALYQWALGGTGSAAALHGILDRTRRTVEAELLLVHRNEPETDLHRRAAFAAGAVLGTILGWLAEPHPASAEEMAAWTVTEIENRLVYPASVPIGARQSDPS
ncbi:TetR/AcrR family transcriptional regulator [Streptomyces collinus]|uniref:TetR/AcrR family transcriptional regulator n=1 Tax=Streptomyces collinus TaxID=42684 RepID=UPI0036873FEA